MGVAGRAVDPRTMRKTHEVEVRARRVIISCGAVQTPHLLLRHNLGRRSKQLGKNFTCHPNVKVLAFYPYDVRGWQGVSQWAQITEFHSEGIILAENFIPPGAVSGHLFEHGVEAWDMMTRYNNMVLSGVLVEDSTTGQVRRGPFDMALPMYNITEYDRVRFIRGAKKLAHMHFAMGADEVMMPFHQNRILTSRDQIDAIDPTQIKAADLELFTPHLMGTCRMGRSPQDSVIDTSGQLWELPGCYVADASVFPTAIGVNPQETIMALASRFASRMVDDMAWRRAA